VTAPDLAKACAHCLAQAPREGVCAYVLEGAAWRFVRLSNIADAERAAGRHHRPATTSFVLDPLEWMSLERAAGQGPVWLVHSHVDAPAELSELDRRALSIDGAPLLPGLRVAIVAIRGGAVVEVRRWAFRGGGWTTL
jgi:proteasome lid subunit RPN8/RPN11